MSLNTKKHNAHHVMPFKTHFTVFSALLIMTALTIYVSYLNLGEYSIYPAMTIAIIMAFLVAYFFMHLKYDVRFHAIVFFASIFFLAVFMGLTLTDIMTRGEVIPAQGNLVLHDDLAFSENKSVSQLLSPQQTQGTEPAPLAQHHESSSLDLQKGESGYKRHCATCHVLDTKLIGPPIREIAQIYKGNPKGIHDWVRNPGKKRKDYTQMPPIAPSTLNDADLMAIANYMLQIGGAGN